MKLIYIIPFLLIPFTIIAQDNPYIIEVVANKNVLLVFPSPIEKGLSGHSNFKFGYDAKNAEKFGILRAEKTTPSESTLHVITVDEKVYSFILKYNAKTTDFDHFFDGSEALGSMKKQEKTRKRSTNSDINSNEFANKIVEEDYYDDKTTADSTDISFCKELLERGSFYKKFLRRNSDITLRLSNIAYKGDKSFIFLTIENKSTVDYDVNFIQFNKTARKVNKKSTYQSIEIKPLFNHQGFKRINAGEIKQAIYVFEKLSIDKNKQINIELNELKGERNIRLPVYHSYINNPNN